MTDRLIDYDRGAIINQHTQTGMEVFMYIDEPGVYLDAHLNQVPDLIAAQAGYDVEKLAKERVKKDRKAQAMKMIDEELADDKDNNQTCVDASHGFKLVSTGLGRHHVLDPEGNRLNNHPLTEEQGRKLMIAMGGASDPPAEKKDLPPQTLSNVRK